ncbi:MAG: calcium-binding protein [Bacteroidota bacterium]
MRTEEEIQERIENEIIVDAYGEEEVRVGWFTHMQDWLQFPFTAYTEIKKRDGNFELKEVEVLRMASDENFGKDIMMEVAFNEYIHLTPLMKLSDIEAEEEPLEAIEDWQYWRKRNPYF